MIESIASLNMMGVLGGAGTATLKQIAKKEGIKKLLTKEGAKLIGKEALNLGGAMAKGAPLTPQPWVRQQQGLAGQKVLNEKGEWAIDKATVEGKACFCHHQPTDNHTAEAPAKTETTSPCQPIVTGKQIGRAHV